MSNNKRLIIETPDPAVEWIEALRVITDAMATEQRNCSPPCRGQYLINSKDHGFTLVFEQISENISRVTIVTDEFRELNEEYINKLIEAATLYG